MAQKSHTEQDRPRDPLVACRVARCWQWRLLRRFTSAKGRVWVKGITVLTCFELSRSGVESPWDGSGFWGRCAFVCVGCCRIAESGRSRRHESRLRIRVARVAVSRGTGVGAGDGARGVGFCPRQGSPFISGVGFGSPSPSRQWTPKYHGARRGPWCVAPWTRARARKNRARSWRGTRVDGRRQRPNEIANYTDREPRPHTCFNLPCAWAAAWSLASLTTHTRLNTRAGTLTKV